MFFLLGKSANSAIRKLTARSIQVDKRRNRFVITTILLAVALMVFLSLYNLGVSVEKRNYICKVVIRHHLLKVQIIFLQH